MKTFFSLLIIFSLGLISSSWAAEKRPSPLVFGDQPQVCKQFIKDYDFTTQRLKNPVQWQLVPQRLLENPKEDYGWYFYKTLKIHSDEGEKTAVFYKRIFKLKGIRQATVINFDADSNVPPLSDKDPIKDDYFFHGIWSDLEYFFSDSKNYSDAWPGVILLDPMPEYKKKLFLPGSKKDLYLINKEAYLFITNEFSPWEQRYYLLLKFSRKKAYGIGASEVCHIQLR